MGPTPGAVRGTPADPRMTDPFTGVLARGQAFPEAPGRIVLSGGRESTEGSKLTIGALGSFQNNTRALRSWWETGHLACGREESRGGQASFLPHQGATTHVQNTVRALCDIPRDSACHSGDEKV